MNVPKLIIHVTSNNECATVDNLFNRNNDCPTTNNLCNSNN